MKSYWIKERHNPQLGIYYTACGQLSKAEAKRMTKALYGENVMHAFESREKYEIRLEQLLKGGAIVQ